MRPRLTPGDILEIPLSGNRRGYAQYLLLSIAGPIISVFDIVSDKRVNIPDLVSVKPRFAPVIAGVHAAVRDGDWKVIGKLPITQSEHPRFVTTFYDERTGEARKWFLWDGTEEKFLGTFVPEIYRSLEFLIVWSPADIARRIETKQDPFPYSDLIKYNRFTPKNP
jgi:hypothetical protein